MHVVWMDAPNSFQNGHWLLPIVVSTLWESHVANAEKRLDVVETFKHTCDESMQKSIP
jgi:hypothetical protein